MAAIFSSFVIFFFFFLSCSAQSECDTVLPDGSSCPSVEYGTYPDLLDCASFWQCYAGCPEHMACPDGTFYDTEHGWCDLPSSVNCGDRPHPQLISTTPQPETTVDCDTELPDGNSCNGLEFSTFPDLLDCASFWQCYAGCPQHMECPTGNFFDAEHGWCDAASGVDCGDRPHPDLPSTSPQPETTVSTAEPDCGHFFNCSGLDNGFYADPYNCRKYWKCADGAGTHSLCRNRLLWRTEMNWCDYPENVNCGTRPVCDECDEHCEVKPEQLGCTSFCKSDFGDFNMGCCSSKYCRCDFGKGVIMACPANLVFVEETDQCDYRSNVPCCSK